MGNGGAKKTNEILEDQRGRSNKLADTMSGYGSEDRAYNTGTRDYVTDQYKALLDGMGSGGYGGGGGGFTPRDNAAFSTYNSWMKNGGFDPKQTNDFRARSEGVIPSFYEGVKGEMDQAANIRGGGYSGYDGQIAKLTRDKAQAAESGRLNSEVELSGMKRKGIQWGAGGVERLDREKQNAERSAAAGRASAGEGMFRDKMGILGELRELRGEGGSDLGYYDRAGANTNAGTSAAGMRVPEKSWMDSAVGAIGGLAGAAAPFLTGGMGGKLGGFGKKLTGNGGAAAGQMPNSNDWYSWATGG